jgi:hypothetical protein
MFGLPPVQTSESIMDSEVLLFFPRWWKFWKFWLLTRQTFAAILFLMANVCHDR